MAQYTTKFSYCTTLVTGLFLAMTFVGKLSAQDWPQWRGENRDGVLTAESLVEKLDTLRAAWEQPIGSGYCGPTVANGFVYVTDLVSEPKSSERVLCFHEATGELAWTHQYPVTYKVGYPAGPRASVSIDEGRAYSMGTMGNVFCFDAKSGEIKWSRDLDKDYQISESKRMPIWGLSASPLVYQDVVIFHIGGKDACVVALNKLTGDEVWKSLDDRAQYSAPILVQQNEKDVVVVWTGDSVAGINPTDGNVFWRYEFKPRNMPIGIATPIVKDNHIFVTSFYDGSLMLKMSDEKMSIEKVWSAIGENERVTQGLHSIISTPIWIDEFIYGVDSYGELRCLEAKTGKRVWESLDAVPKARWSTIHFVKHNDNVWMFNERGELVLAKLSPEGFEEISRKKIIEPTKAQLNKRGGVCWSHPAFANGSIFVRNDNVIKSISLLKNPKHIE